MLNPVVMMLRNTKTERFHPIVYIESPFPGGAQGPLRWKSKGHHTVGFDTREEAIVGAMKICQDCKERSFGGNAYYSLDEGNDGLWDGDSIPASVMVFDLLQLKSLD